MRGDGDGWWVGGREWRGRHGGAVSLAAQNAADLHKHKRRFPLN